MRRVHPVGPRLIPLRACHGRNIPRSGSEREKEERSWAWTDSVGSGDSKAGLPMGCEVARNEGTIFSRLFEN